MWQLEHLDKQNQYLSTVLVVLMLGPNCSILYYFDFINAQGLRAALMEIEPKMYIESKYTTRQIAMNTKCECHL